MANPGQWLSSSVSLPHQTGLRPRAACSTPLWALVRYVFLDGVPALASNTKPASCCMYCQRAQSGAVVHLHSTYAVALSLIEGLDPTDILPPLTAYYVMRVGRLPLIPYYAPGDKALALAVQAEASSHHALLLANHCPIVAGKSLRDAQYAIEEIEEAAKLYMLLGGRQIRPLTRTQAQALHQ